jgi:hypothetical protein
MRRHPWRVWLLLAASVVAPAAAAQSKAVATLADVRGVVEVKAKGAAGWTAVKGTRPLQNGDAVRIGQGGRALLLQPGSPPRALKEGDAELISANRRWTEGVTSRPLTGAQHASMARLLDSAAQSSRSRPTVVRAPPYPDIALSPRWENVLDGRPVFVWKDQGPGSKYELEVFEGNRLVWALKTGETRGAYPADRAPLKSGAYVWQLHMVTASGRQDADGAEFSVPEAAAAAKIRDELAAAQEAIPEAAGLNLPLVSLYVDHHLYSAAEAALQKAITASPGDAGLHEILAHVYSLMRRKQAQADMLQKAKQLSGAPAEAC